jgi:hypothetical protein
MISTSVMYLSSVFLGPPYRENLVCIFVVVVGGGVVYEGKTSEGGGEDE